MGPDIINISWNGEEYLKYGVREILLVAKPVMKKIPVAVVSANVSTSKCSVTVNIKPSTAYRVFIKEISKSNMTREVHYVATTEGGE